MSTNAAAALTAPAQRWVESQLGRPVVDAEALSGGWTSTMLALTLDGGAEVVLRLMTKEPWLTFATELLERESLVQQQLETSSIAAPGASLLMVTA